MKISTSTSGTGQTYKCLECYSCYRWVIKGWIRVSGNLGVMKQKWESEETVPSSLQAPQPTPLPRSPSDFYQYLSNPLAVFPKAMGSRKNGGLKELWRPSLLPCGCGTLLWENVCDVSRESTLLRLLHKTSSGSWGQESPLWGGARRQLPHWKEPR